MDKRIWTKGSRTPLSITLKTMISKLTNGVGGDHPAWDIIITKLDFHSQMKIAQQNHRLSELVQINAEYSLRKFRRQIRDDKYM